jgi:hypothetical protein
VSEFTFAVKFIGRAAATVKVFLFVAQDCAVVHTDKTWGNNVILIGSERIVYDLIPSTKVNAKVYGPKMFGTEKF